MWPELVWSVVLWCSLENFRTVGFHFPDFLMYEQLDRHLLMKPDCLDTLPKLKAYHLRFRNVPSLKKFMQSPKCFVGPCLAKMAAWGGTYPVLPASFWGFHWLFWAYLVQIPFPALMLPYMVSLSAAGSSIIRNTSRNQLGLDIYIEHGLVRDENI